MTENIRLTIKMRAGPGVGHPYVNGDGLVAHLEALEEYGREYLEIKSKSAIDSPVELDLDVPLEETEGVRHASISFFDSDERYQTTLYSQYDEKRAHEVESRRQYINQGSGEYKSQMITQPYYAAHRAVFFFRGDLDRLKELFDKHFSALGKKRAAGFGDVYAMEWDTLEEDRSLIHDGQAMRPIPVEFLDSWEREEYTSWKPPYWLDENHARCAPPGTHVEWNDV